MKYYSPKTKGFYDKTIHRVLPIDCIEISEETYQYLLDGQSKGMSIIYDTTNGLYVKHVETPLSYVESRLQEYVKVGDALDSIYKYFNYRRMQGDNLTQELDDWVNSCTQVKRNNPKPEEVEDDTAK